MFDGTLGNYTGLEYKIKLVEVANPYHINLFLILRIHKESLNTEVNRWINKDVLKSKNNAKWAASTFIIPKKNGRVCFISDLRELNIRFERKPFPIPKMQDLLFKLEGFKHPIALDLNMDIIILNYTLSQ